MRVRRTEFLFLYLHSGEIVDLAALVQGSARLEPVERVVALSALAERETALSRDELALLLGVSARDWVEDGSAAAERLARAGLLVSDSDEPELAELRRRDERLAEAPWHPSAALLHFGGKWRGVDLGVDTARLGEGYDEFGTRYDDFVRRHGSPPPPFLSPRGPRRELPLAERSGGLYDALARRRTTRAFDPGTALAEADLALLLRTVFGPRAYARLADEVTVLQKTSPSGGARHALEAHVLTARVAGVERGLHRYDGRGHALELVRPLDADEAARLATTFASGQAWVADAAAVVVLTARFGRSFWKYRRHNRAYLTLFLEAGHFAQTFALVCAELGLGAFFSAAVNGGDVEDALGLDPVEEGVLALCGCGRPLPGPHPLQPDWQPYVPRDTSL